MKFPERTETTLNLLKLKAGESVTGVFRGEIHVFRQHWELVGGVKRPAVCTGAVCERCKAGIKSVSRFQLNFVTKENAVLVAKVFEGGYRVQKQLEELNKEYPLENHFIKITRVGNGTDTTYMIMPIANSKLNKSQETEAAKVQLNALGDAVAGVKQAQAATDGPEAEESANEDVPF